jgi:hypothetical protein
MNHATVGFLTAVIELPSRLQIACNTYTVRYSVHPSRMCFAAARIDLVGSTHNRMSCLVPRFTPFHFDRISINVEKYLAGSGPRDFGDSPQPCSAQCLQKAAILVHHGDVLGQSLNITDAVH